MINVDIFRNWSSPNDIKRLRNLLNNGVNTQEDWNFLKGLEIKKLVVYVGSDKRILELHDLRPNAEPISLRRSITNLSKSFWEKVPVDTKGLLWRHTIGRISCAIRAPLQMLAAALCVVKSLCTVPFYLIVGIVDFLNKHLELGLGDMECLDRWRVQGIALDLMMATTYARQAANSLIGVMAAPDTKYNCLFTSVAKTVADVILGNYHTDFASTVATQGYSDIDWYCDELAMRM